MKRGEETTGMSITWIESREEVRGCSWKRVWENKCSNSILLHLSCKALFGYLFSHKTFFDLLFFLSFSFSSRVFLQDLRVQPLPLNLTWGRKRSFPSTLYCPVIDCYTFSLFVKPGLLLFSPFEEARTCFMWSSLFFPLHQTLSLFLLFLVCVFYSIVSPAKGWQNDRKESMKRKKTWVKLARRWRLELEQKWHHSL